MAKDSEEQISSAVLVCRAAARHTSVFRSLLLSVAQVESFQKEHQKPTELLWKEKFF